MLGSGRRGGAAQALSEGDPLPPEDHWSRERLAAELEQLYRSRGSMLAGKLTGRGTNRCEGLDILHDAFAKVLSRGPARLQAIAHPEAYVVRVSRNLANDRHRAHAVREEWAGEASSNSTQHHDQVVYLETRDTLRRLEAAVMMLRPRTRQVFLARRLDGLSYAEIAELTGMSVRAVERQMSKAIAKLSRLMDRA